MIIGELFADRWVTGSQGQLYGALVDCYTLAYLGVARSSLPIGLDKGEISRGKYVIYIYINRCHKITFVADSLDTLNTFS